MHDILQSAHAARSYVQGKTLETFRGDSLTQDAVIRRLEIIGEAAGRLSLDTRRQFPQIPWNEMTRLRHDLIHQYDTVNPDDVWRALQDIPALIAIAEPLLADTPL